MKDEPKFRVVTEGIDGPLLVEYRSLDEIGRRPLPAGWLALWQTEDGADVLYRLTDRLMALYRKLSRLPA
jgi:hypothetical protein